MHHNENLIIHDVKTVKEVNSEEYGIYQRLYVDSIIASPFTPNSLGFLAARNPTRYVDGPSMLRILAYVRGLKLRRQQQGVPPSK